MSDSSDDGLQEFIAELPSFILSNQIGLAASALLIYDFILTLPTEITEVWMSKFTGASALLLSFRYATMVYWIAQTVDTFSPGSNTLCSAAVQVYNVAEIISTASSFAIFALRTWAIYEKNFFVLGGLICLALGALAPIPSVYWVQQASYSPSPTPLLGGCSNTLDPTFNILFELGSYFTLAFHTAVFMLTLYKTLSSSRQAKAAGIKNSLFSIILRDGTLYYTTLVALDIADDVIVEKLPSDNPLFGIVSFFASILDAIITYRLVLNLRQISRDREQGGSHSIGNISLNGSNFHLSMLPEPEFATNVFLGNLGAPLRDDEEGDDNTGEEYPESESGEQIQIRGRSRKGKEAMVPDSVELDERMGTDSESGSGEYNSEDRSQWRVAIAV